MKRRTIIALLMSTILLFSFSACGESADTEEPAAETTTEEQAPEATYDSVYDEYTVKLQDKGSQLLEEYKSEAADLSSEQEKLDLSLEKTQVLVDLLTEGQQKMYDITVANGDDQEVYEEWANKLSDVYAEQADALTDAYIEATM